MTDQEILERRIRFAEAIGFEIVESLAYFRLIKHGITYWYHDRAFIQARRIDTLKEAWEAACHWNKVPDPDTNSDDRWALLEWFIRQPYVSDLRMWVYPAVSKKPGVSGVYASLPYPNIPNCEAVTLTEALLQAIDAALLAGKEGK